jgi:hypothetical protein
MRKFSAVPFFAVISLIAVSCSNFAMPERVHVKAGINPNIPVNSAKFNLSETFQDSLSELFTGSGDNTIKVFNYTGDVPDDPTQKFLISFSMKEQSLDFENYLSGDLGMDSALSAINRTFTLDNVAPAENQKISLDMTQTITTILGGINLTPSSSSSVSVFSGSNSLSIPISAAGFTSLSFYSGSLDIMFSLTGSSTGVTLNGLTINNSIPSSESTVTLTAGNPRKVSFPLAGKTLLSNSLVLSGSYYAASTEGSLSVSSIVFSDDKRIQTVKGVYFDRVTDSSGDGADNITLDVPAEFVQAIVDVGDITLDTSVLKGIELNLMDLTISQDLDSSAASGYQDGLSVPVLANPVNLTDQKLNRNSIKTAGNYTVSVRNQADTEVTFTDQGKLEIPVSFRLESFKTVYISGQKIIDEFNSGEDSNIEISLSDLSKTVSSITLQEAGAVLTFGESVMTGLDLKMSSDTFEQGWFHQSSISKEGPESFTQEWENPLFKEYPISPSSKIEYRIELKAAAGSSATSILELSDITVGQEVTLIACTPKVVFDWTKATIKPAVGDGENFNQGRFPEDEEGFSLTGNDLDKILNNMEFEGIKGYLFFSGPELSDTIDLTLTAFPAKSVPVKEELLTNEQVTIVQTTLNLPKDGEPVTDKIPSSSLRNKTPEYIDFDSTFNKMLKGEKLSIEYNMDFGSSGLTITKDMATGDEGVKAFKADLVIIVPLKLKAGTGGANIDVTEYLGGMTGNNLLSFMENTGDTEIGFNKLALKIGMTGTPLQEGSLIIKRDTVKDGASQIDPVPLSGNTISIDLTPYLGASKKFTLTEVKLGIAQGGYLEVPQGLSLISLSVDAGVDAYIDL